MEKRKPRGSQPRPDRPAFGSKIGCFCKVPAYSNVGFDEMFKFDFSNYEKVFNKLDNFLTPEETGLSKKVYSGFKYYLIIFLLIFFLFFYLTN
jgi:hypothetical protein